MHFGLKIVGSYIVGVVHVSLFHIRKPDLRQRSSFVISWFICVFYSFLGVKAASHPVILMLENISFFLLVNFLIGFYL